MAWIDFDDLDDIPTIHAISDPHCEAPANMDWLRRLPACPLHTVVVAGDLAVDISQIEQAFRLFLSKYKHVFYCFGNHECWVSKKGPYADSLAKIGAVRDLCRSLGVRTDTALVDGVWIVPVFGWYHSSWDTEPDLAAPPGERLRREPDAAADISNDYVFCKWGDLENGSEALAERLDRENEAWGSWPLPPELVADAREAPGNRRRPIISFSHFLPRLELLPEKRFSMQPNLAKLMGSNWIQARVEQLRPDVHVFGHTHNCWDMRLNGTRYRSWPLGMPMGRLHRAASFPSSGSDEMLPLPVMNGCNEQAPEHEHCFASRVYAFLDRDPSSYVMSHRVAARYCPSAPVLFDDVVMPGRRYPWDLVRDQAERDRMIQACTRLNQSSKRKRRAPREWEVIGGAASGGVPVREDGPSAPVLPEGLAAGALVEELQQRGGHVCFSKLSGAGPSRGWAPMSSGEGPLLRPLRAPPEPGELTAPRAADLLRLLAVRLEDPGVQGRMRELLRSHPGRMRVLAPFARERRELLQKEFDAVLPRFGFPRGNLMQLDVAIQPFLNVVTGDDEVKALRRRVHELMMLEGVQ